MHVSDNQAKIVWYVPLLVLFTHLVSCESARSLQICCSSSRILNTSTGSVMCRDFSCLFWCLGVHVFSLTFTHQTHGWCACHFALFTFNCFIVLWNHLHEKYLQSYISLFIHPSVCLSVCLSIHPSIHPSIQLSVCIYIYIYSFGTHLLAIFPKM